jgi:hypothetical protein
LLTSLKEKLIKIGAKVVSHGRYVTFQLPSSLRPGMAKPCRTIKPRRICCRRGAGGRKQHD